MIETKFTPGPWNYDKRVGCVAVYAGEKVNCMADLGDRFFYADGYKKHHENGTWEWMVSEESDYNARLIASAPDMYEALTECLTLYALGVNSMRKGYDANKKRAIAREIERKVIRALFKAGGGIPNE